VTGHPRGKRHWFGGKCSRALVLIRPTYWGDTARRDLPRPAKGVAALRTSRKSDRLNGSGGRG